MSCQHCYRADRIADRLVPAAPGMVCCYLSHERDGREVVWCEPLAGWAWQEESALLHGGGYHPIEECDVCGATATHDGCWVPVVYSSDESRLVYAEEGSATLVGVMTEPEANIIVTDPMDPREWLDVARRARDQRVRTEAAKKPDA